MGAMSYRQQVTWLIKFQERKHRERLYQKLNMAEAFNVAYIGSQPPSQKGKRPPGAADYKRWRKKNMRELFPAKKDYTIWDIVEKNKKRLILN